MPMTRVWDCLQISLGRCCLNDRRRSRTCFGSNVNASRTTDLGSMATASKKISPLAKGAQTAPRNRPRASTEPVASGQAVVCRVDLTLNPAQTRP
jgi:hypothetical protein